MSEGSLYDRELAALAIKQARGDLIEAIFLVRAYRTTLPRFGTAAPIDTAAMDIRRRISATFKDLPGGQVLGPTFDYTHRLLDHELAGPFCSPPPCGERSGVGVEPVCTPVPHGTTPHPIPPPQGGRESMRPNPTFPRVTDLLANDDVIEPSPASQALAGDLTREPLSFPAGRDVRLQNLARGDEGFLLALGYSTQRGYGRTHPFAGEIRFGEVEVEMFAEEVGFAVALGRVAVTECQSINQFRGTATQAPRFTRGYGLAFGQSERKAMAMALVDRALRARELGEEIKAPAQDEEFVLSHSDNVQATGFVEHLKLPHYVDFQSELGLVRRLREMFASRSSGAERGVGTAEAAE
jgi:alpha-D-ribose 1-methylphosphonate 5-triphosphate synthase subunit PhnI